MTPRFHVAIKNQVGNSPLELYFLDYIQDTFDWSTFNMISMVADTIAKIKEANPSKIKLVIDSQGGDAGIGLAIYNYLKNSGISIEAEIIGIAGSIATVIASAASPGELKIARNAFFVIHKAWGGGVGNAEDLRAAADIVDKYTNTIVDIYHQRTGKPAAEIDALIANGDYWMTGPEAVDLKFADSLLAENTNFKIAARIGSMGEYYKNIPQNLTPDNQTFISNLKHEFMNILNSFKTAFGAFKPSAEVTTPTALTAESIENALAPVFAGIEAEFTEVKNSIPTIPAAVPDLTETVNAQAETIKQLQADIATLIGGGSVAKPAVDAKNAIGGWVE